MTVSTAAEYAALYAKAGFSIVPLHMIHDAGTPHARCNCNAKGEPCRDIGKHPVYRVVDPVTGEQTASRHAVSTGMAAHMNYGLRLAGSGFVVVDIDSRDITPPAEWQLTPTYTVRTGRGWHLYYTTPLTLPSLTGPSRLAEGIDLKATGWVVGPGSEHKNGERYTVQPNTPQPAPLPGPLAEQWVGAGVSLRDRITADHDLIPETLGGVSPDDPLLTGMRRARHGSRNSTQFHAGCRIMENPLCGLDWIDALRDAAIHAGRHPSAVEQTLRSSWTTTHPGQPCPL